MEYLFMVYGRDFEPMAEILCDSYMILEFYAMSTCWPYVHCQQGKGSSDFLKSTIITPKV